MNRVSAICVLVLAGCGYRQALAQDSNCRAPAIQLDAGSNLFTPEQEIQLGDVLAGQLPQSLRVAGDPALADYLNRIGERLAAHLPSSGVKFRYFAVDLPAPNAFSIAGGRIYVTRGLASFVRNEDELASVIAHEMGHIAAHQTAISLTALFREVLGVNAVTSKQDIVMDLSRTREALLKNPQAVRRRGGKDAPEESAADQIGFYAAVSAGYSPQAFAEVFDRIAATSGKTGNWFTDFVGATRPDQRRLRDMIKMAQSLPTACVDRHSVTASADFERWKTAVLHFSDWNQHNEQLHGLLAKVKLESIALRDVSQVRFSPNGKYVLAREADQVYVFTSEPFAFLFQIKAQDAVEVLFTADSTAVAFATALPHIEVWDIESQAQAHSYDILERHCTMIALSPAANALACLGKDENLDLLELPSGAPTFQKKHFAPNELFSSFIWLLPPQLRFSPDGRYFLASRSDEHVAYDLTARQSMKLSASLNEYLGAEFAFLGSDRIVTARGILSFPEGKLIAAAPTGRHFFSTPTRGDYALIRPFDKYPIGIVNLKSKKVLFGIEQQTIDIYDNVYVRALLDGDLGIFDIQTLHLKARAPLPNREGAGFQRAFASRELNWIAGCGAERCALWNASTGKRVFFVRAFDAGWFDGESAFYADFVKFRKLPRMIGKLEFSKPDAATGEPLETPYTTMLGRLLVIDKTAGSSGRANDREEAVTPEQLNRLYGTAPCTGRLADPFRCDATWEFRDAITGELRWSRHFAEESPAISLSSDENLLLFRWAAGAATAQDELKNYPAIAAQLADKKEQKDFQFIEIVDAATGQVRRAMLADAAAAIRVMGTRMIALHRGYMEIYSLETGRKEGEILSLPGAYSNTNDFITVHGENRDEVAIFDLKTREKVDEFTFSSGVAFCRFSADGKRLLVLTHDQTAYMLEIAGTPAATASARQ